MKQIFKKDGFIVAENTQYTISLYQAPRKLFVSVVQGRANNVIGTGRALQIGNRILIPVCFVNATESKEGNKKVVTLHPEFYLMEDVGNAERKFRELTIEEQDAILNEALVMEKGFKMKERTVVPKAASKDTNVFDSASYREYLKKSDPNTKGGTVKVNGEWMEESCSIQFEASIPGAFFDYSVTCVVKVAGTGKFSGYVYSEWYYVDPELAAKKAEDKAAKKAARKAKEEAVAKKLAASGGKEEKEEKDPEVSVSNGTAFESEAI